MPEIKDWLSDLKLEKYVSAFTEAEIDFEILPKLEIDDLKELGLPLGPRRKIMDAISRIGNLQSLLNPRLRRPIQLTQLNRHQHLLPTLSVAT